MAELYEVLLQTLQAHRRILRANETGLPTSDAPDRPERIGGALAGDRQDANEGDWQEVIDRDGRRIWQRVEIAGYDAADFPTPCDACGGIDQWQDLRGGWHCEACEPRTIGPRLRETAQRLRVRELLQ